MKKYQYKGNNIRLVVEEDCVGFYLIFYPNVNSSWSEKDYLLDTLDDAFDFAKDEYGVHKHDWIEL